MGLEELDEALGDAIRRYEGFKGHDEFGEYGPSQVSGCPLKVFLDEMTDTVVPTNRWTFSGSAVHSYLQNTPDLLPRALRQAGFHPLDFDFEVSTDYHVSDDIVISGSCDILAHDEDGDRAIVDIKYSSIPPSSGHGRLYKYMSQANAYGNMFNADRIALLMINSKSDDIPSDIDILTSEVDDENWEIIKEKVRQIHSCLDRFNYDEGNRFDSTNLDLVQTEMGDEVTGIIDKSNCPSYEKECQYCDHKDYCPVFNSGIRSMGQ